MPNNIHTPPIKCAKTLLDGGSSLYLGGISYKLCKS